jgi:hypothetical protein
MNINAGWTRSALGLAVALTACTAATTEDNDEVATAESAYVTATPGASVWSKRFGTELANEASGVASDRDGNAFVFGDYQRSLPIAGTTLTTTSYLALFLAKYDGYGHPLWVRSIDDAGARGAVAHADGAVSVLALRGGAMVMRIDASGGDSWSTGVKGAVLAGNDAGVTAVVGDELTVLRNDGAIAWTRPVAGRAITVDGSGNAVVGTVDGTIAKYDPAGAVVWTKTIADRIDVLASSNGGLIAAGAIVNGGAVVLKLGPDGDLRFERPLLNAPTINALRIDHDGAVVVTGTRGTEERMFLMKLSPVKGITWWSREYTSTTLGVIPRAMDLTPSGRILVAGTFYGAVDFGNGPRTSAGTRDAFLVRFNQ